MQDRGKHLAGTAPGCRKIQNGHALCFGLGKIIIADFGNHKKFPPLIMTVKQRVPLLFAGHGYGVSTP